MRPSAQLTFVTFTPGPSPITLSGTQGGFAMDMNGIMLILFGSVISVTTALTFMEVRRMRKGMK
jgi:hypothetical protein